MKPRHLLWLPFVLAACGGSKPATPVPPTPPTPPTSTVPAIGATDAGSAAQPTAGDGNDPHKLLVGVAACWFGGVWSDAEGADALETRRAASEARCHDVTRKVFGSDDKEKYEQLRAFEANALEDLGKKIADLAKDSPAKDNYGKILNALAAAKKEEMLARRAGDRVKRDIAKEPDKLTADEVASVGPLKQTTALEALLKLDAGDLSPEAHAFALMSAMERMAIARGLPKHLKVYAVSGPFKLLFNVEAPAVPEDATKPLKPGMWLAYLMTAAKGAGHAVPDSATTPAMKEPAAWAGVLEGLHDKLRPMAEKISADTQLKDVVVRVARRLEHEYNDERNTLRNAAQPAVPGPAQSGTPAPPPPKDAKKK